MRTRREGGGRGRDGIREVEVQCLGAAGGDQLGQKRASEVGVGEIPRSIATLVGGWGRREQIKMVERARRNHLHYCSPRLSMTACHKLTCSVMSARPMQTLTQSSPAFSKRDPGMSAMPPSFASAEQ